MNTLKKRKSGKKGFTLMEMLIVVAIIGILIAIAIPTFSNALNKARVAADEANLHSFYSAKISDHMLNETALPHATTGATTVEIDGTTYTLQAGKYDITQDTANDTFYITYHPEKGPSTDAVIIPGGSGATHG